MDDRWKTVWDRRSWAIFAAIAIIVVHAQALGEPVQRQLEQELLHARAYYKLALAQKGDLRAFDAGIAHLQKAEGLLQDRSLPRSVKESSRREIQASQSDFDEQRDMAHDTLRGLFPLTALLGSTLFEDDRATGVFELLDDPDIVAVTGAAAKLLELSSPGLERESRQARVVISSSPENRALENEVRYLFNEALVMLVETQGDLARKLSPDAVKSLSARAQPNGPPAELEAPYDSGTVLFVKLSEADLIEESGVYWYLAEGRFYQDGVRATSSIVRGGFCIDRREQFRSVAWFHVLFFVLAVGAFIALSWQRIGNVALVREGEPALNRESLASVGKLALVALVPFIVGRIAPWFLVGLTEPLKPAPETMALLSFWWPLAAGGLMLLGPVVVYYVGAARLKKRWNLTRLDPVDPTGRCQVFFPVVALGAAAYLCVPFFLYFGSGAPLMLAPTALSFGLVAWMFGRGFDDTRKSVSFSLALASGVGVSIAVLMDSPEATWLMSLATAAAAVVTGFSTKRMPDGKLGTSPAEDDEARLPLRGIAELNRKMQKPKFQADFPAYSEAKKLLAPLGDGSKEGKTVWLGLLGEAGIGKTATAEELISELVGGKAATSGRDEVEWLVLTGKCQVLDDEQGFAEPYYPIRQAFAKQFNTNLLQSSVSESTDDALDDIFEAIVPAAGLLLPPVEGPRGEPSSLKEVYLAVVNTVRKLAAKNKKVVLFLDDIHWLDDGSFNLLKFMREHLEPGGDLPLLVLWTAREVPKKAGWGDVFHESDRLQLTLSDDSPRRRSLLTQGLNIEEESAEILLNDAEVTAKDGAFEWLIQLVRHLNEKGVFVQDAGEFRLADRYKSRRVEGETVQAARLPFPDEFRDAIAERIPIQKDERMALEVAACMGMEVSAQVLADALGLDRLDAIGRLHSLELTTGLVRDVGEQDDLFAFRSPFVLEVVRENMKVTDSGPMETAVPQIVREYHGRTGAALEQTLEHSSAKLYTVFKHYYAAGALRAPKAVEYGLEAVHAARRAPHFESASKYLEMVAECAKVGGISIDLEAEKLLIDLDRAFVTAEKREEVADDGLKYLERQTQPSHELLVAVARACYDAGTASELKSYFAKAAEISSSIIESATMDLERAEGLHFRAISLLSAESQGLLLEARELLELPREEEDLQATALLARIYSSLGETLMWSPVSTDVEAAQDYFEKSIDIKQRPEIHDKPGLARSYGGLGRLMQFKRGDIDAARKLYQMDLDISLEIGDLGGQSQMHSLLGGCDLEEAAKKKGEEATTLVEKAYGRYVDAWDLAQRWIDFFHAALGLLKCCVELEGTTLRVEAEAKVEEIGPLLLAKTEEENPNDEQPKGMARHCAVGIADSLRELYPEPVAQWVKALIRSSEQALAPKKEGKGS